jgi:methylated-DNA-[protein]-cysteine S-methyltransferase
MSGTTLQQLHLAEISTRAVGRIRIAASDRGIAAIAFADWDDRLQLDDWERAGWTTRSGANPLASAFLGELAAYDGGRFAFTVPHDHRHLTPFTRAVLDACRAIPPGRTASYGELAVIAGSPGGARAVGQAMHRNPTPILVPCHRVTAAGGDIGGFTPGLDLKRRLFAHEGIASAPAARRAASARG